MPLISDNPHSTYSLHALYTVLVNNFNFQTEGLLLDNLVVSVMNNTSQLDGKKLGGGPKTRVCYICGRQYGLSSFEIHLKQCKELWIAREALKDPKERKPLPPDPVELMKQRGIDPGSNESVDTETTTPKKVKGGPRNESEVDLDEINRMASETFNSVSLSTCVHCGRSFLAEKLAIHNKSCTAENPARRVGSSVSASPYSNSKRGVTPGGTNNKAPRESTEHDQDQPSFDTPKATKGKKQYSEVRNTKAGSSSNLNDEDSSDEDNYEERDESHGDNPALAGHLGGSAGRQIRGSATHTTNGSHSTNQSGSSYSNNNRGSGTSQSHQKLNKNIDDNNNDVITKISNRLVDLEATAYHILESISELKQLVNELRNNS